MAVLVDRAKMSTATTGTGTITLGSAVTGFQSFASAGVTDGQVVRYVIEDGSSWEIGTGTYTSSGTTLSRTPDQSSAAGAAINLSGSAFVFVTAAADDIVTPTGTQTLTNKTLTDPAIVGAVLEDIYTISDGAAFEIDPSNGTIQLVTLGSNRTPKGTNFANGESVTLMVDDGSASTLTWTDATWGGSGVVWKTDAGAAPTLNTSGYTAIVLWKVGNQVYGARVGDA